VGPRLIFHTVMVEQRRIQMGEVKLGRDIATMGGALERFYDARLVADVIRAIHVRKCISKVGSWIAALILF
jgi:hypothetical protein